MGKSRGRNCLAGHGDPKDLKLLPAGPGQRDATFRMATSGFIVIKKGYGKCRTFLWELESRSKVLILGPSPFRKTTVSREESACL